MKDLNLPAGLIPKKPELNYVLAVVQGTSRRRRVRSGKGLTDDTTTTSSKTTTSAASTTTASTTAAKDSADKGKAAEKPKAKK